jgi:hypothetical protein
MAVRISAAAQWLQGSVFYAESCPSTIGPITIEMKQTGKRSAGNPHAGGNWKRGMVEILWHSQTKERANGEHGLRPKRRASARPYLGGARGGIPWAYSAAALIRSCCYPDTTGVSRT